MTEHDALLTVDEASVMRSGRFELATVLPDARGDPLLRLPSHWARVTLTGDYAGAWVEMLMNPPWGLLNRLRDGEHMAEHGARELARVIRDWNLAGEDGAKLPPSEDGLNALPLQVVTHILTCWAAARDLPPGTAAS